MWYPLGKGKTELHIPMQDSSASLFAKTATEYSNDDDGHKKTDQSNSPHEEESGPFQMIKVFGHRAWTIISQTVCSIQAFCTGLIFSGMQIPNKMLSSGR
jgi:hypothetical protein